MSKKNIIGISTYALKPGFQRLLTGLRDGLIAVKITPNQITLFTCLLCIIYALLMVYGDVTTILLAILPVFLFMRMALNALDGMVAAYTDNRTPLGAVLNEVCDVVSDFALFIALLVVIPDFHVLWLVIIVLAFMIEFLSLAVFQAQGERPNSGPFAKSDRALYLGLFALLMIFIGEQLFVIQLYLLLGVVLALLTLYNRFKVVGRIAQ